MTHRNLKNDDINIVKDFIPSFKTKTNPSYRNFQELVKRSSFLKLKDWIVIDDETLLIWRLSLSEYLLPKYEIIINGNLEISCLAYGWHVPEESCFFKDDSTLTYVTLSGLLK